MKKLLLLSCLSFLITFNAFSQRVYLADTAFTTDTGFGGAPASCVYNGGSYFSWLMGRAQHEWLADVFTVPTDSTWIFDTVIVYGYLWGAGTTSAFLNCNLQIYNGAPGLGGSIIWGDTSTNILVNTGFTGIYRVDTTASSGGLIGTDRAIMYLKLHLSPPAYLSAGTYWLSWSAAGASTSTPASPPKVLPGRINPASQQARQFYAGSWNYVVDHGHDEGFNMIIKASDSVLSVPHLNMIHAPSLCQNVPNPFSEQTEISFSFSQPGNAKLCIYNTIGQLVATLFDGDAIAGKHQLTFNTGNLPAGVYYYQLVTNTGIENKQMLLVK